MSHATQLRKALGAVGVCFYIELCKYQKRNGRFDLCLPKQVSIDQKARQILIAFLGLIQLWQANFHNLMASTAHLSAGSLHRDCRGTRNPQVTQNKHFGAKIWNRSRASITECTDLFTAFTLLRSPPANVPIASGSPRGTPRGLEKVDYQSSRSTSGESSPACTSRPVIQGPSETSHEHHHHRSSAGKRPHCKALCPFAHM